MPCLKSSPDRPFLSSSCFLVFVLSASPPPASFSRSSKLGSSSLLFLLFLPALSDFFTGCSSTFVDGGSLEIGLVTSFDFFVGGGDLTLLPVDLTSIGIGFEV